MLSPGRMRPFSRCQSSGRWRFGSHWPFSSRSENTRSFARERSSSRRAPPNAAWKLPASQRVEQRLGLEQAAASLRADGERLRAVGNRLLVGVDDQLARRSIACTSLRNSIISRNL